MRSLVLLKTQLPWRVVFIPVTVTTGVCLYIVPQYLHSSHCHLAGILQFFYHHKTIMVHNLFVWGFLKVALFRWRKIRLFWESKQKSVGRTLYIQKLEKKLFYQMYLSFSLTWNNFILLGKKKYLTITLTIIWQLIKLLSFIEILEIPSHQPAQRWVYSQLYRLKEDSGLFQNSHS